MLLSSSLPSSSRQSPWYSSYGGSGGGMHGSPFLVLPLVKTPLFEGVSGDTCASPDFGSFGGSRTSGPGDRVSLAPWESGPV